MADAYHAECIPCGWVETYALEDDAIAAVESHVALNHATTPPFERLQKKIGHVQMRTVEPIASTPPAVEILPPAEE